MMNPSEIKKRFEEVARACTPPKFTDEELDLIARAIAKGDSFKKIVGKIAALREKHHQEQLNKVIEKVMADWPELVRAARKNNSETLASLLNAKRTRASRGLRQVAAHLLAGGMSEDQVIQFVEQRSEDYSEEFLSNELRQVFVNTDVKANAILAQAAAVYASAPKPKGQKLG